MDLLYLIAMYGSPYLASTVHRDLGREFQENGHRFTVFALATQSQLGGGRSNTVEDKLPVSRAAAAGRADLDLVNVLTSPIFKYSRFITGLAAYARFSRSHREFDLVLAEGAYPFGAIAALESLVSHRPFVITVAGGDFIASRETQYGYGRFAVARKLTRFALQRSAAIRVTTPLVRDNVIRLGAAPEKISLLPRNLATYSYLEAGENVEVFREEAQHTIRNRYHLGKGPLLVCVGRLLPIKGFDDAIRALHIIQESFPDVRLLIVGPDRMAKGRSYGHELQRLATELRLSQLVVFPGTVPHSEVKTLLGAADLLLVPSILEGMNRTVLEAAAVGTPSVVSRTAGIANAASLAGASVVVDARSPGELATTVCTLLRSEERRLALGRAGIVFAQRFTPERIACHMIELCNWVLDGNPRSPHATRDAPSFEI